MKNKFVRFIMVTTLSLLIVLPGSVSALAASLSAPQVSGQANYNSVTVQYASPNKVSGYEVTLAYSENGVFNAVYVGTKTSTTIKALKTGSSVYIKVRSYQGSGSKKTYSEATMIRLELTLDVSVLSGKSSKGTNTLTWTKVSGATSYEISSSSSYAGDYKVLISVNTLTYNHKVRLKTNTYYKVRAYTLVNGVKVYSPSSNIIVLKS